MINRNNDIQTSRSTRFLKDFGIYTIGNIGLRLFNFILVPLYTHFVAPDNYGYFDLCLTICFLLIPIATLQLREGGYRFLLDTDDDTTHQQIVSFVTKTIAVTLALVVVVGIAVSLLMPIRCLWFTITMLVTMVIFEVMLQLIRALFGNKVFVTMGIGAAFLICVLSVLFVVVLKWDIYGIFLANIISKGVMAIWAEWRTRLLRRYCVTPLAQLGAIRDQLLKFSLPLLPNALCWWLISSSNRFFIKDYIGLEENGKYAVAVRMVNILFTFGNIFYQTWQEHAFTYYNTPGRNQFFSKIFNYYLCTLSLGVVIFAYAMKIAFPLFIAADYRAGVNYLFPMAFSTMFYCITFFFEMGYQCAKDTLRSMISVICAAVLSFVLNYVLVRQFQIYGIIMTSVIVYLFLAMYRWLDTKRYFDIKIERYSIIAFCIALVSIVPYYFIGDNMLYAILALAVFVPAMVATFPAALLHELVSKIKRNH